MRLTVPILCLSLFACGEQTVKVVNTAPNVSILVPSDNAQFVFGSTVDFSAVVDDSQQGAESLAISWNSDIDGELNTDAASGSGEVNFSTINLSLGSHLITLRAIDDKAEVGEDQLIVQIVEPEPETDETEGKTGGVFCAAGGQVSGGNVSGWPDIKPGSNHARKAGF